VRIHRHLLHELRKRANDWVGVGPGTKRDARLSERDRKAAEQDGHFQKLAPDAFHRADETLHGSGGEYVERDHHARKGGNGREFRPS
jgi:hypothetical protein